MAEVCQQYEGGIVDSFCVYCKNIISEGRASIGYNTCINCGQREAADEIVAKSKRVSIPYNKGAYMYLTPGTDPKDIGKKT